MLGREGSSSNRYFSMGAEGVREREGMFCFELEVKVKTTEETCSVRRIHDDDERRSEQGEVHSVQESFCSPLHSKGKG
ncbi:hypothetical protein SADUNF_Sadunf07G0030900 [Salix dunnii]|uniref:Uncharacterized protein n=1 Tax=Salix dunnii TaxID=1413687 RepID=A0A835N265_9ROSI|nr:hypothetical protein SADUNF_Sadunf07G0030900 [Salix dunnii]